MRIRNKWCVDAQKNFFDAYYLRANPSLSCLKVQRLKSENGLAHEESVFGREEGLRTGDEENSDICTLSLPSVTISARRSPQLGRSRNSAFRKRNSSPILSFQLNPFHTRDQGRTPIFSNSLSKMTALVPLFAITRWFQGWHRWNILYRKIGWGNNPNEKEKRRKGTLKKN